MSTLTEDEVFNFIKTRANPTVTLDSMRAFFPASQKELLKHYLGQLFRKALVFRHSKPDGSSCYWTALTANEVQALGIKTVPEVVKPIATQKSVWPTWSSPKTGRDSGTDMTNLGPATGTPPATMALPPTNSTIGPEEIPRPARALESRNGALQRGGMTGKVAMAMYLHAPNFFTCEDVQRMRPDVHAQDIKRILNLLAVNAGKEYLKRSGSAKIVEGKRSEYMYAWSGKFAYPFADRSEYDGHGVAIITGTVEPVVTDATQIAVFEAFDKLLLEGGLVQKARALGISEYLLKSEATFTVGETFSSVKPSDFPSIGVLDGRSHGSYPSPHSTYLRIPKKDFNMNVNFNINGTQKEVDADVAADEFKADVDTPHQQLTSADVSVAVQAEQVFSAALDTKGELDIVLNDTMLKLDKEQTQLLIGLLGPFYRHHLHQLV